MSWNDVQNFIRKLNVQSGLQYRLPTEAEWEYAARAGTTTAFSFGNMITTNQVNHERRVRGRYIRSTGSTGSRVSSITVGSLSANAWGLHEMHGNVSEWVSDWYASDYYQQSPKDDPEGSTGGSFRVYRGGSWSNFASSACSASRRSNSPGYRNNNLGFRLARTKN